MVVCHSATLNKIHLLQKDSVAIKAVCDKVTFFRPLLKSKMPCWHLNKIRIFINYSCSNILFKIGNRVMKKPEVLSQGPASSLDLSPLYYPEARATSP